MSSYGYGPPPPPPPSSSGYAHPSTSYSHQQGRGGGGSQGSRGRGGQYPRTRGDHRAPPLPYYDFNGQPYHSYQASYGGSHTAAASYASHPSHWTAEHGHAPQTAHPHAPAPLSSSNYHPNYSPPSYSSGSQHPPLPSYGLTQPYGQHFQSLSAPQPAHWTSQDMLQPLHYSGSRGRGGYNDRRSAKPALSGGDGRHAYEHVPAGVSHVQPFSLDPRAPPFPPSSFPYSGPAPSSAVRRDNHHSQDSRRGRGGGSRDGVRGRGGHHNNHHSHQAKNRHHNKPQVETRAKSKPKTENSSAGKKKKRKVNTLGLTPGEESESEDDEGEEKALKDLIGPETLQISDVAAFVAERRRNYPTKARVEAKKASQLVQRSKTADLEKQAEKLRKQLAKVEFSIKRKREQGDEGDEMRGPGQASSEDEKPEVVSSRVQALKPPLTQAQKADVSRHCKYYSTGGTCGKKGKCRFVHDPAVREAAIKEREANNGRLTIQQRLILNDKEQEDLTVLRSIQYVRQKGIIESTTDAAEGKVDGSEAEREEVENGEKFEAEDDATPALAKSVSNLFQAPPDTILDPSVKDKSKTIDHHPPSLNTSVAESASDQETKAYEGWLLKPYGHSRKSDQSQTDDLS